MGNTSGLSRLSLFVVAALVAATVVLVPAGSASAAPPTTCGGRTATIIGTGGADRIIGTPGPDVIVGRGGDDLIRGGGGNDIICGNKGRDRIFGGPGDDIVFGNAGQDVVRGNGGEDEVFGGGGSDRVIGGAGDDVLAGGPGLNDRLFGSAGFDVCTETGLVDPAGCDFLTTDPISASCQDRTTTTFDLLTARDMIQHASMAYAVDPAWDTSYDTLNRGTGESDLDPPDSAYLSCWDVIDTVERGSTQGYVAINRQTQDIVVAFRGTDDIPDAAIDAAIAKADWNLPGKVERDSVHSAKVEGAIWKRADIVKMLP